MYSYKIKSGVWTDLTHTNAALEIEQYDNNNLVFTFSYGLLIDDKTEMSILFWEQLKDAKENKKIIDNDNALILAGKKEPVNGTRIIQENGKRVIVNTANRAKLMYRRIRERINELHSGYELAMCARHPTREKNRQKTIEALLCADQHADFPYINLEDLEGCECNS